MSAPDDAERLWDLICRVCEAAEAFSDAAGSADERRALAQELRELADELDT
ncbi:MAG TPA: hypothetical protein VNP04_07245 [Alphaproteobacteria bacterium]|nr:hypothetical protein [Alphaproteobacteria bacterium]